jgi:hypothetical protein
MLVENFRFRTQTPRQLIKHIFCKIELLKSPFDIDSAMPSLTLQRLQRHKQALLKPAFSLLV